MMKTPAELVLYSRPGCHLCELAREAIDRVSRDLTLTIVERDIESDDRLMLRYLERIPVVVIDGVEAFELDECSETALRRRLDASVE